MAESRTKIARELSAAELDEFLADLRKEKRLTGARLMELAQKRGISIGHSSAAEFLNKEFKPYLEKLQKRSRLAQMIAENTAGDDHSKIADAAAGELAQGVFELLTVTDIDVDLLTSKDGLKQADTLSKIISRIRSGDHRLRALEKELQETREKQEQAEQALSNPKLSAEQKQNRLKEVYGIA